MTAYNYAKLTKKLKKLGFIFFRQAKGSHEIWMREIDQRIITIPKHGNKDLKKGTLNQICKDAGVKNQHGLDQV